MSVCLHDETCPGYGESHDEAMAKIYEPPPSPVKEDLSHLAQFARAKMPARIELPEVDQELSPSTKMLLVMAHLGKPIYQGTSRVNRVQRRAKRKAFRRARAVHRG